MGEFYWVDFKPYHNTLANKETHSYDWSNSFNDSGEQLYNFANMVLAVELLRQKFDLRE